MQCFKVKIKLLHTAFFCNFRRLGCAISTLFSKNKLKNLKPLGDPFSFHCRYIERASHLIHLEQNEKYLLQTSYKKSSFLNESKPVLGVLLPDDTKQMPISSNLLVQPTSTSLSANVRAFTVETVTKSGLTTILLLAVTYLGYCSKTRFSRFFTNLPRFSQNIFPDFHHQNIRRGGSSTFRYTPDC